MRRKLLVSRTRANTREWGRGLLLRLTPMQFRGVGRNEVIRKEMKKRNTKMKSAREADVYKDDDHNNNDPQRTQRV